MSRRVAFVVCTAWAVISGVLTSAETPPLAQAEPRCRIEGRVTSGSVPLPGVSILVQEGEALTTGTSTDGDGRYVIVFRSNSTYRLYADLTAFTRAERNLSLASPPCDATIDFQLTLKPRSGPAAQPSTGAPDTVAAPGTRLRPESDQAAVSNPPAASTGNARGRGAQSRPASPRFQSLNVEPNANGAATGDLALPEDATDLARLLPPGFTAQTAQADAIAISGRGDAANVDRGLMSDRGQAIRIGDLDPVTGQFAGSGPPDGPGRNGDNGSGGLGGGRGGGPGGRGAGPGRGGLIVGGRGARGQNPYQGSTTYSFGGSALNSAPYQLRPDVPVLEPQFGNNTFGATFGGPFKIPGIYANANRRTNVQVNYTGSQGNNVFDQYATVPTDAMRSGDFSATPIQLIDPATGRPLPGNQIPAGRIDPGSAYLLTFIPKPNLSGSSQNYHVSTTSHATSDSVSLRLTQNLSPNVVQGGRGADRGGGRFGGPGTFGGGAGRGARGTNVMLNVQMQYRRNQSESLNVFPDLGATATTSTFSAPISLNVANGRSVQNFTLGLTHSSLQTTNAFSGVQNVAGQAGINYPSAASTDPLNWGVPNLAFAGFTGVQSASASRRTDNRLSAGYVWFRPIDAHRLRLGGDYRLDASSGESNANARGTFTFTGLYSSSGSPIAGTSGADFADFLMGLPQLATLQVGGTTKLRQRSFDLFVEDNWQKSAKLTFNLGIRYELAMPYVEENGRMTNLDVTPTFTAAAPVVSGGTGPFTGPFPAGLLDTDANNVAPRLGVAYRLARNTILRGGYGITFNSGSYAVIARQLVAQPPFADTQTVIGSVDAPLTLADALLSSTSTTTNNWGVDRTYALGRIQTWNAAFSRDVSKNWTVSAAYTGTKGTDLDILRAPNRGPDGLLIPDVQAFTWESSEGHSILNAFNLQIRRRLAGGISGGASYTLAKSMDNASSLGAGSPVVAQNDKDLASEWALSSFDRRQQFSGDLSVELPFGPNRRWLSNGGVPARIVGEWTVTLNVTLQSGTPYTARVVGATSDVSRGTNGSLRADYTGGPIQLSNPMVDAFFNAAAFVAPAPGMYGDSARNMIIGPGARQLNGLLTRDVRLSSNRTVTLQVNAVNLLNTVQWASIDTNVSSPTFGQVLSARPMRTVTITARFRF